ncbi:MAG: UDP-2,4-diacetamido-2,4,6-trideoxy-beta-L-altropyranose hydrolase [Eubacteriales bacterium]|nr:UDP-2,4-diacetamido-2,4,6-trideoxy-beta-L-altropyranose hydrolase [Eubacteriales bacterium]
MQKHIYIRADGNEMIATGHIMRCLSVANQLKKWNIEVTFLVADDRPRALIESRGFSIDVLNTVWNDLDTETEIICDYVKENQVEILLLDSYFVTKDYLQKLSQCTKIVYIDDLCAFAYSVHTLVNYYVFGDIENYHKKYAEEAVDMPHILIGGSYIPLREEFAYQPFEVREEASKVLITTGGTDQLNVAGNILERVIHDDSCMELDYHVIVGCFNQNKEHLYALSERHSNIYLHENVTNMSEWMRLCDIAISAGGTTLYELGACGIPTICLEIASNQEGAVAWEQRDYMTYAGNACKNMEVCMKNCLEGLRQYVSDYELRLRRSNRIQELIDGNGARRIAKYIETMF